MKKAFSRRNEFVSMIEEAAEAEGRLPEELVEEWTETYQGQTINSIREIMKAKQAKKVVRETPMPVPAEETHIDARS
jgi:SOS-response transcriptional repressor LexA